MRTAKRFARQAGSFVGPATGGRRRTTRSTAAVDPSRKRPEAGGRTAVPGRASRVRGVGGIRCRRCPLKSRGQNRNSDQHHRRPASQQFSARRNWVGTAITDPRLGYTTARAPGSVDCFGGPARTQARRAPTPGRGGLIGRGPRRWPTVAPKRGGRRRKNRGVVTSGRREESRPRRVDGGETQSFPRRNAKVCNGTRGKRGPGFVVFFSLRHAEEPRVALVAGEGCQQPGDPPIRPTAISQRAAGRSVSGLRRIL